MQTLKLICLLLTPLLIHNPAFGQANGRTAVVNVDAILAVMPGTKHAESSLEALRMQLGKRISTETKSFQTQMAQYEQQRSSMTPSDRKQKEQQLLNLRSQVQRMSTEAEQTLKMKRNDLLQPVLEKLANAIESVRKQQGYAVVINSAHAVSFSDAIDLTTMVKGKLGL